MLTRVARGLRKNSVALVVIASCGVEKGPAELGEPSSETLLLGVACATTALELSVVGTVYVSELLFGLRIVWELAYRRSLKVPRVLAAFMVLCSVWLGAQIISDAVNGSELRDAVRGWARAVFLAGDTLGLWLLVRDSRKRLGTAILGIGLGLMAGVLISPNTLEQSHPWKFGVGGGALLISSVFAGKLVSTGRVYIATALMILYAAVSLSLDSRLLAGLGLLGATQVVYAASFGKARPGQGRIARAFAPAAVAISGYVFMLTYRYLFQVGVLGGQAAYRFQTQMHGAFGVLLGARKEAYAALRAISDRPLIGHGSWARNADYALLLAELEQYGYVVAPPENDLIPTHSHILGGWVEGGVLCVFVWAIPLFLVWRVLPLAMTRRNEISVSTCVLAALLGWDVLFSPLGGRTRVTDALAIVACMVFLHTKRVRAAPHDNFDSR